MKAYLATFHGDIEELSPVVGETLEECLNNIMDTHGFGRIDTSDYEEWAIITPDPEDDKIEVWEVDTDAKTAIIVWGFFGWHWQMPEDLMQGKLPGHDKSLYEIATRE